MRNKSSNVIWVDFKSGRKVDLTNLGHPQKPVQPIPYLCQLRDRQLLKVGRK